MNKMNLKATPAAKLLTGLLLVILTLGTTGCQTFTLTKEEFARQQRGEAVDEEVGKVVQTVGTAGYYGAMIGAAFANLK